ncbi:MAG TPA: FtsX-like permease family protein [Dysgonamonadaceae bacterium]|nr:FtsX-like permease family protein [Dysgonamonadaceae bacterium]
MIKHLLKIIWNERSHNIGIWIELFLVSLFLWYITDYLYVTISEYNKPLGFDIENTYLVQLGILNEQNIDFVKDESLDADVARFMTMLERIQHNSMIEAASISFNSSPHIGNNSAQTLFRDTLQSSNALRRMVTPDFFRVFRYKSKNGSTDELVQALENDELVISANIEKNLFGKEESAVGKDISFEKSDSAQLVHVGGVSTNIRYDNFSNWESYFASKLNNNYYRYFARDYVDLMEICVRVKPEEDYDFSNRFRQQMTEQLRLGNYYLNTIQSIPENKKAFQLDDMNDLRMRFFIIFFLLINIFLGITGTFWFRTQYRRNEIGVRIAMGETRKGLLKMFYTEGLLLLTFAMIPAMLVFAFIKNAEILHYYWTFTIGRYFIGFGITYLLLALMILLGIWFPARRAVKVSPADALRDE